MTTSREDGTTTRRGPESGRGSGSPQELPGCSGVVPHTALEGHFVGLFVGLLALPSPLVLWEQLAGLPGWVPLQLQLTQLPCSWGTEELCPETQAHTHTCREACTHVCTHAHTRTGTGKQREDRRSCPSS